MNIETMETAVKFLKQYNLQRICIESNNLKLEIENSANPDGSDLQYETQKFDNRESKILNTKNKYIISSPIVGIAHILDNPLTNEKYCAGDSIERGKDLCTIEAMKMFNPITSDNTGIIEEILFSDNQFVEYNQPLFKIVKSGE